MQVVRKLPLQGREMKLQLPTFATIIRIGIDPDGGRPTIWYLCNTTAEYSDLRSFLVVQTNEEVPDNAIHRGMWWEAAYVFHLFELETDPALLVNVLKEEV